MKPPIGLKPKKFHDEERLNQVRGAICRYYDANLEINIEWIKEYNNLIRAVGENAPKECNPPPKKK